MLGGMAQFSASPVWRRWARRGFAVLLGLPSLAGALDFPAGYPTWYRCIRYGAKNCDSIKAAVPAEATTLFLNWDLSRGLYVCGLLLAVALLIPWRRLTGTRLRRWSAKYPEEGMAAKGQAPEKAAVAKIVFDPANVKHVQPGIVDIEGASAGSGVRCDESIYALGIVSLSVKPIRCRLVLEHSVPHNTAQQRLERSMKVRNDPSAQSDGYFTLNPGDGRPGAYVEVLQEVVPHQPDVPAEIRLTYANTLRASEHWFGRGGYILTFRLEGDLGKPIRYGLSVVYESSRRKWRVEPVRPLPRKPPDGVEPSEIIETYAEIGVHRTGENTFDVALTFSRNVAAVLPGQEFPGAYLVIWNEPFASADYIVDLGASKGMAVREELSRRTRESIVIYFGLEEKAIIVTAKGRR